MKFVNSASKLKQFFADWWPKRRSKEPRHLHFSPNVFELSSKLKRGKEEEE
jgi:hypothetical protein